MTTPSRAILITGSGSSTGLSSGTGKATALRLHQAGFPVYATGRDINAMADLAAAGVTTLHLDVTDEKSMQAVVDQITDEHGAVGCLINNAAFSLNGTIGETPMDAVRNQFEINVFGLSRLTQLVLPGMRAQGAGRIILMSSIFGLFSTPGRGYYQATKFAVEAIGDSLRNEVRRFGIKVVIIEPSPILGGFVPESVADLGMDGHENPALYQDFWNHFVDWHQAYRLSDNPPLRGKLAVRADAVSRLLERAVTEENPKIRYRLGIPVRLLPKMRATIGERGWDRFVRLFFPIP